MPGREPAPSFLWRRRRARVSVEFIKRFERFICGFPLPCSEAMIFTLNFFHPSLIEKEFKTPQNCAVPAARVSGLDRGYEKKPTGGRPARIVREDCWNNRLAPALPYLVSGIGRPGYIVIRQHGRVGLLRAF